MVRRSLIHFYQPLKLKQILNFKYVWFEGTVQSLSALPLTDTNKLKQSIESKLNLTYVSARLISVFCVLSWESEGSDKGLQQIYQNVDTNSNFDSSQFWFTPTDGYLALVRGFSKLQEIVSYYQFIWKVPDLLPLTIIECPRCKMIVPISVRKLRIKKVQKADPP